MRAVMWFVIMTVVLAGINAPARGECSKEGDPAFYIGFGENFREVYAGMNYCWQLGPANMGCVSSSCHYADTFCVHLYDSRGWTLSGNPALGECQVTESCYYELQDVCIDVPCDVELDTYDTLIAVMTFCNSLGDLSALWQIGLCMATRSPKPGGQVQSMRPHGTGEQPSMAGG
ncbi:MAG: hypothetical protein JXB45_09175 [Candidatus Krumholzibacteriota bacterium]|nr:hypothetical protein [Candidatus Krumholzibacteriota bacterium]